MAPHLPTAAAPAKETLRPARGISHSNPNAQLIIEAQGKHAKRRLTAMKEPSKPYDAPCRAEGPQLRGVTAQVLWLEKLTWSLPHPTLPFPSPVSLFPTCTPASHLLRKIYLLFLNVFFFCFLHCKMVPIIRHLENAETPRKIKWHIGHPMSYQ